MTSDNKLYDRCRCTLLNTDIPIKDGKCALCKGVGFCEIGLTTGQLERLVDQERILTGDPGVPAETAIDFLRQVERLLPGLIKEVKARLPERKPAFVCHNCGATAHFVGTFAVHRFERQHRDFHNQHAFCLPTTDGGCI